MAQGRRMGMLPYGNGCRLHPDCFTCPLPECVWLEGTNREKQQRLINLERPFLERVLGQEEVMGVIK